MDPQQLADEWEIRQQLARFARILDSKAYDRIEEVYAQDLRFDYGIGGEQAGIETMRGLLRQFLDTCGPTQHLIGSIAIEVIGDDAISRAYVQARHQRFDDIGGPVFDTCGDYVDRWARTGNGWRIVRRDVEWSIFSGDTAVLGSLDLASIMSG